MADYLKATGQEPNKELAEQAVNKTLEYIKGKDNYAVKYNFTWINERYSLLSKTAQPAKYDYSMPEHDETLQDDDDQDEGDYSEVPEKIIHLFENVSATWPIACRTGMKPIYATRDSITIGVSGALRVDVAQAHYGKTLQNAFMKPVVFEVMQ